jgi:flagellar hook-associated protein 3 FlgL
MSSISTSTGAFFQRARAGMATLRGEAENLQSQLGTGEKLGRSSDDPVAASRLRMLGRLDTLSNIDRTNADRAQADLALADSAMSDMAGILIRAQELAMQAANATLTEEQRGSIGGELKALAGSLFALSNARDASGHALFGGTSAGDAYQLDGGGNAVYVGTAQTEDLPLGDGQSVRRSMTGPEFLHFDAADGSATDLIAVVKDLGDTLAGGGAATGAAAQAALADLSTGLEKLTTGQTVIGTRMAWIELTDERRVNTEELRGAEQADIGATDLAGTIARLQETMLVLEASQASFGKLSALSLFDQLR